MSHTHHHTPETNQPTNYLLRVIFAFVFVISVGCILRVLVGNQECTHCNICAKCETCEKEKVESIAQSQLWGAEAGEGECGGCNEGEEKACCKKKDKCEEEHDKAEVKEEKSEEHAEEKTEAKAEHK